jgi:hypothetical protein
VQAEKQNLIAARCTDEQCALREYSFPRILETQHENEYLMKQKNKRSEAHYGIPEGECGLDQSRRRQEEEKQQPP